MFARLLFWTAEKPNPRVIATGTGKTLEGAMAGCFAPIGDKTWKREYKDGKLFLRRGGTGYCGEIVNNEEIDLSVKQPVRSRTVKQSDGWWVTGIPDCDDCGPYKTKDEAEEHRRGLQRTYDNIDDPTFFTSEKLKKQRARLPSTPPRTRLTLEPARTRQKL